MGTKKEGPPVERLYAFMQRMLKQTPMAFTRSADGEIGWSGRMFGIVGPRGVGKSTLVLQRIKRQHSQRDTLYVSADNMYFGDHTLYDTAEAFVVQGGRHLFIDEVHKYGNWSQELKMMYDTLPSLQVCFTGSSVLDITRGWADLSRRAPLYTMQGLSFREYLAIAHGATLPICTLEDIVEQRVEIGAVEHPVPLFKDYLKRGYYPFGREDAFEIELDQVISQTLEVDIPQFAGMTFATGQKLKQLMAIVSTLAPFKPNATQLASQISISRNSLEDYLGYMEKAGMVARLRQLPKGLGALGKVEKVYLDNTNILYNLSSGREDIGSVRETFFLNQVRRVHEVYASPAADFLVDGMTFEVGGKGKTGKQVKGLDSAYIVKDDIEYGYRNVVPLWAFGLLY